MERSSLWRRVRGGGAGRAHKLRSDVFCMSGSVTAPLSRAGAHRRP